MSKWQVGTVAGMAFLGFALDERAIWSGVWCLKMRSIDNRGKWKMQLDPLDVAFLTVHLLSFSFSCSLSSFFLLYFFSFSSSSLPPHSCFSHSSFLSPRLTQRDPCSPSREWEVNSAVPKQEWLHLCGHCTAKAVNIRSDPVHTGTGTQVRKLSLGNLYRRNELHRTPGDLEVVALREHALLLLNTSIHLLCIKSLLWTKQLYCLHLKDRSRVSFWATSSFLWTLLIWNHFLSIILRSSSKLMSNI